MRISQVCVNCFSCVCLHMPLGVHFTVICASTARGHVWTQQVHGCVCVNIRPLSVSLSMWPAAAHRGRKLQHICKCPSARAIPAFRGKKLLTVGNAIKRN